MTRKTENLLLVLLGLVAAACLLMPLTLAPAQAATGWSKNVTIGSTTLGIRLNDVYGSNVVHSVSSIGPRGTCSVSRYDGAASTTVPVQTYAYLHDVKNIGVTNLVKVRCGTSVRTVSVAKP